MKIKQLVWVEAESRYGGMVHKAATVFGNYTVFGDGEVWTPAGGQVENGTRKGDNSLVYTSGKLEDAKAWAQTDFEKRVTDCYEEDDS